MTAISIVALLVVLACLYCVKKELRRVTRQLRQLNSGTSAKKIDLAYFDKDLERLAEAVNEQIDQTRQANADKRRTEYELKQAISSISHDIRTPMTSILGYVQFLETEDITPEQRGKYTEIVKKGALRLKVLLEDFFELSIIESADYPLNPEAVKLNELLPEVLVGFYEQFAARQIEPVIHIPEEEAAVVADPSAVKRVIENLVMNAIRHSSGKVVIQLEKSGPAVRLTVSNPADLLREQDLQYLFNRFYTGDQPRTGKGTGLGLSIARSLMLKMNGELSAELKGQQLFMVCEWQGKPS
ncbi:HAMP domain-containing sensor histidine kinase [Paenibacillus sp. MMS20-IR301]|uniref:sensor histidine kinase n=1 Tax=Paenibacillus sp. MMS20-IR301 TaxID=2895946 RepID=UPI0028E2B6DF|nr:HAMP domain-containing sensor histidine kinase [Paenibacillus sp. MMS20-IR301]WNS42336.1 HAMP domain-containing sensor histidine kinase [Paenibacillus sp. MMS20-IR301]